MKIVALIQLLQTLARDHRKRTFFLRELALLGHVSHPSAAMSLIRAQKSQLVFRVGNLWVNRMDPPSIEEVALALESPSYVSFETALYHHNLLSQSPRGLVTLATCGRPRRIETPLGMIQFIHLKRPLFFGYDADRMATPEKAWLDLLYIRSLRGGTPSLTEQFYPEHLNKKRLRLFQKRFPERVRKIDPLRGILLKNR